MAGSARTVVQATEDGGLHVARSPLQVPVGWAVVESRAAGVCATDLHILRGRVPGSSRPVVLGHEGAGVVVEVPAGEHGISVGDRVVLHSAVGCDSCTACCTDNERCAAPVGQLGFDIDGTFADRWAAPLRSLVPIPDDVSFETAAPMGCAGITALHAVSRSVVSPDDSVVVHGIGGVGLATIQVAAARGARVIAVGDSTTKAQLAADAGAWRTLVLPGGDADLLADRLGDVVGTAGVDHFIDLVGTAAGLNAALESLAVNGTVVVGSSQGEMVTVDPALLLRKEARLVGTLAGSRADLVEALEMASRGELTVHVDRRYGISKVASALERIANRQALGRNLLVW